MLGLKDAAGVRTMTTALSGAFDVSGAALPAEIAAASSLRALASAGASATLLRLEGTGPRCRSAAELARDLQTGPLMTLDTAESMSAWREVRDVAYFAAHPDRQIWRLSVPPASGAEVIERSSMPLSATPSMTGAEFALAGVGPQRRCGRADRARRRPLAGGHAT